MSARDDLLELQREIYLEHRRLAGPLPRVMPWLLDRRNLDAAWSRVAEADGARTPGGDGVTVRELAPRRDRWLSQLGSRLYQGRYLPAPPRWIDVPKGDGAGTRRLGILTVEDRVVHAAWKQVLEPVLEPSFSDNSFGFRPGRSVAGALDVAVKKLSGNANASLPYPYVCKLDVADCFDTIDHACLGQRLRTVVADEAALELLDRLIAVGGRTVGWWPRRTVGVVQGSSLSPLLCNFHLDPLDRALAAYSARTGGGVQLLRYADDLLLLARSRRMALAGLRFVRRTLAAGRQRLKRTKTRIVHARAGLQWLGVLIRPRAQSFGERLEFGYEVPKAKVSAMLERIDEITAPPSARIDPSAFDLSRWLASINDQLRDWWQAYVYAENAPAVFRKLDEHAYQRVGELLAAVTGERRRQLWDGYERRLARGFRTWQIDGTRLTVLSSLAPRNPAYLLRRPDWMRPPNASLSRR